MELANRRQKWLNALRAGHEQTTEALIRRRESGQRSYCCMGVGLDFAVGLSEYDETTLADLRELEHEEAYTRLMTELEFNRNMRTYLIGMNDGSYVYKPKYSELYLGTFNRATLNDALGVRKIIRNTNEKRDFKFIARFLELYWALQTTTNTVNTATQTDT